MNKYSFNVFWSDEDEGFIAVSPEFPGLSAFGKTPEKAMIEAQIALQLFIETYEAEGLPLPEPQIAQRYSGQTRVRLPKSLHFQLAQKAESEGISLNLAIVNACQKDVTGDRLGQQYLNEIKKLLQNQNALASLGSAVWSGPPFKEQIVTTETERIVYAPDLVFKKGN